MMAVEMPPPIDRAQLVEAIHEEYGSILRRMAGQFIGGITLPELTKWIYPKGIRCLILLYSQRKGNSQPSSISVTSLYNKATDLLDGRLFPFS